MTVATVTSPEVRRALLRTTISSLKATAKLLDEAINTEPFTDCDQEHQGGEALLLAYDSIGMKDAIKILEPRLLALESEIAA